MAGPEDPPYVSRLPPTSSPPSPPASPAALRGRLRRRLHGRLPGRPAPRRLRLRRGRRDRLRPLGHVHGQVRGALDDVERPAHRGGADPLHRRPLVREAGLHVEPVDVAAEAFLLLRVGHGRAQHLRDVARHALAGELQQRERLVHVTAADEVEHEARLLRGRPDVLRGRFALDHDAPPPAGFGAAAAGAAPAAGAAAAAFSLLVVCPLNDARRRELAELVPDHVLRHVDRARTSCRCAPRACGRPSPARRWTAATRS